MFEYAAMYNRKDNFVITDDIIYMYYVSVYKNGKFSNMKNLFYLDFHKAINFLGNIIINNDGHPVPFANTVLDFTKEIFGFS